MAKSIPKHKIELSKRYFLSSPTAIATRIHLYRQQYVYYHTPFNSKFPDITLISHSV